MTRIIIPREPIDPGKIVRNPKVATEWKKQWGFCWMRPDDAEGRLQVHHIVGGAHRSDEPCNFACLCQECHAEIERYATEFSVHLCMYLKRYYDPSNYDKSRIEALFGRRLDQ